MRKLLVLLIAVATLGASAAKADVFLLGFTGFDYEDPNSSPATYLAVGEGYKALGFITSVGPLLAPYYDPSEYEYTLYLFNLTVATNDFDAPNQFLSVTFNDNGRARYFEDGKAGCSACVVGTAADYGIFPPNATAPSTFIDGNLKLGGDVDGMVLFFDYSANQGGFTATMTQDEGSDLQYIPAGQRGGWTLGGLLGRPGAIIPAGYVNQVVGECYIPEETPVARRTWGSIKALYNR
jgi:hypothetical protein